MNDQLMKMEQQAESLLKKIERQYQELQTNNSESVEFKIYE